jgi:hypothetical protein
VSINVWRLAGDTLNITVTFCIAIIRCTETFRSPCTSEFKAWTADIWTDMYYQLKPCLLFDPKNRYTKLPCNICNYLPIDKAYIPEDFKSSTLI